MINMRLHIDDTEIRNLIHGYLRNHVINQDYVYDKTKLFVGMMDNGAIFAEYSD